MRKHLWCVAVRKNTQKKRWEDVCFPSGHIWFKPTVRQIFLFLSVSISISIHLFHHSLQQVPPPQILCWSSPKSTISGWVSIRSVAIKSTTRHIPTAHYVHLTCLSTESVFAGTNFCISGFTPPEILTCPQNSNCFNRKTSSKHWFSGDMLDFFFGGGGGGDNFLGHLSIFFGLQDDPTPFVGFRELFESSQAFENAQTTCMPRFWFWWWCFSVCLSKKKQTSESRR